MQIPQVGLVTGGASGMGLAVVESLVGRGWNIAVLDKNPTAGKEVAERLGPRVIFLDVDVTDYDAQAEAFVSTWKKWGRLDFVYANAGISDRTDLIEPVMELDNGAPPRPDTFVVDVCLRAVIYTSYLALYFFRKGPSKHGNLVMTSSIGGIYATPGVSAYGAAKHGVVGLTRSLAYRLQRRGEFIRVNTVCPAFVPTGLINPELIKRVPVRYVTATATIVRAVEKFIYDESLNGEVAECSGDEIFYRPVYAFTNEGSEWVMSGGLKALLRDGEEQAVRH